MSEQTITMTNPTQLHHMVDVLRLVEGEHVKILDGSGRAFVAEIASIDKEQAILHIVEQETSKEKDAIRMSIACALPKRAKIKTIVEKLTELGVERIYLLTTQRTEVKLKDETKKIVKLVKTTKEALKQSAGLHLPKIEAIKFPHLLKKAAGFELALLPHLGSGTRDLRSVIDEKPRKNILVAIGPEGDFSHQEIQEARQAGFIPVSLGPNVLKVDTAAIAVTSFLRLYANVPHTA